MERAPEQKLWREKLSQERIRSALYDVLKLIPPVVRETLNEALQGMEQELQRQLEGDETHLVEMRNQNTDPVDISNWEAGVRQKRETVEAYKLAKEALRDISFTGKGSE